MLKKHLYTAFALLFSQCDLGQKVQEQHLASLAYSRGMPISSEEEFMRCVEQANIKIEDIPKILKNHGERNNFERCYIVGRTYFIPHRIPKGYMSKNGIYINFEDGSCSVVENTKDHYWGSFDKNTNSVYALIKMDMEAAEPFKHAEIYGDGNLRKPYHVSSPK